MAVMPSTMLELGTPAPEFTLLDTDGDIRKMEEFEGAKALVVMFICNHCPYVRHIADALGPFAKRYREQGVAFVAISSNDAESHPEDGPPQMREEKKKRRWPFPYLFDATQDIAKAYRAACTPDFFLFDENRKLVYRGQFDDSRPGNDEPVDGHSLGGAIDALLEGKPVPTDQKPSQGCSIKWKKGKPPEYMK